MAAAGAAHASYLETSSGSFAELAARVGLDARLTKAIARAGYVYPTLVQAQALPLALAGKDLLVRAHTGSGKTAAYALAVLQKVLAKKAGGGAATSGVSALILVPSRELVEQTAAAVSGLAYYCGDVLRVAALGGGSAAEQAARLAEAPDVVVSTPGRVVAHLASGALSRAQLQPSCDTLVVDEADLVLAYGGGDDVRAVIGALPRIVQALLLSATLSPALDELRRLTLHSPVVLKLEDGGARAGAAGAAGGGGLLSQFFVRAGADVDRYLLVYALLKLRLLAPKALIFVNDVSAGYKLKLFLERFGIGAGVLNGSLPANSRQHIIEAFNRGAFDLLIATDEQAAGAGAVRRGGSSRGDAIGDADGAAAAGAADSDADSDDSDSDAGGGGGDASTAPAARASRKRKRAPAAAAAASTAPARDAEFGAARGLDFRGVSTVVNFDVPPTADAYVHRIGRTARGGAAGVALTVFPPAGVSPAADALLAHLHAANSGGGGGGGASSGAVSGALVPAPLPFDAREVEGFRYRVEDVLRGVTRGAVRAARLGELRREMLASEALRAHFEDHPRDLALLQHDAPAARGAASGGGGRKARGGGKAGGAAAAAPQLREVPSYLLPPSLRAAVEAAGGGVGGGGAKKARRGGGAGGGRGGGRGRGGGGGGGGPATRQDAGASGEGKLADLDGGAPAATGRRVTDTAVVAQAAHEAYHARRNAVDPLRSFAANAAVRAAAIGRAGGGRGGRASGAGAGGPRRGGGRGGATGRGR